VLNAIDASRRGQVIKVSTHNVSSKWVEFSVRDFGSGIKLEHKRRLFEMFFTTKTNGFGVGLYVARILVKQHKGDIDIKTKVDAGTTFTVRLPK
jgi:two-component system sporulation sensor kinase A